MATQVLRNLGSGWLQCQDNQGTFFFNEQTRVSCTDLPPELGGMQRPEVQGQQLYSQLQAQQLQQQQFQQLQAQEQILKAQQSQQVQPVVKKQMGVWQVCEDAQGEFYFNSQTGQSFEQPPAGLVTSQAPKPQSQSRVKSELGPWCICEDAQGEFYFHAPTGQSFDQPPAELVQLYKASQAQQQVPQQAQAPQPAQTQQAQVKLAVGNWLVCQDGQGEFYVNSQTRQEFSQPPQELVQLLAKSQPTTQTVSQPTYHAPQPMQYIAAQPQVPQQVQYMKYGGQR
jgi:hypothetical protein